MKPILLFSKKEILPEGGIVQMCILQKTQAPLDFGQAAKDFGRGLPELEADIRALLELGLLERQEDGKIVCPFGEIRAEFSLKRVA